MLFLSSITTRRLAREVAAIIVLEIGERALGELLDIRRSSVSDWRIPKGRSHPASDKWESLERIAKELGVVGDLNEVFDDDELDFDDDELDLDDDELDLDGEEVWVIRFKGKKGGITPFGENEFATEEEALDFVEDLFGGFVTLGGAEIVVEQT